MSIWKQKQNTQKHLKRKEFLVHCDCAGGGDTCAHLRFAFWEDDNDKDLVYISFVPDPYQMKGFLKRLKYAWNLLISGQWANYDELVLEKRTVDGWIEELQAISTKMKEWPQFK